MSISPDAAFDGWLHAINRICDRFDGQATGAGFQGRIVEHRQGALKMSTVHAAQARLVRQHREVQQSGEHHFFAVFQLEGTAQMRQGEVRETLQPGDIMFIDNHCPSAFDYQGPARQLSLIVPHARGQGLLQPGQKVGGGVPVAGLATQLLLGTRLRDDLSQGESEAVLDAILGLLRPALLHRDVDEDSQAKAYRRCVAWIEQHLGDSELTPERVAHECGMSLRGLYRVFGRHGASVAQHIRDRRLDRCAQNLRDGTPGTKLAALAYQWGFTNSSHFNTAFKARFGVAPGEYRRRCH